MQYCPNSGVLNYFFMKNGILDTRMIFSPHYTMAKLYFKNGKEWLKKNYKDTDYYYMRTKFQNYKDTSIEKFSSLCDSIKNGYLQGKYKDGYPVILEQPFAKTRYNIEVPVSGYEVFSGHHRIGIMLALGMENNEVMIAEDLSPGLCYSLGKIHNLCVLFS
jgi:hypothetical protein